MIESYGFGRIVIGGRTFTSDVIVYPDWVDPSWWRQQGHLLQPADLAAVLAQPPEVLVVGTGAYERMIVAPEVEARCTELGVRLLVRRSFEACEEYNRLSPMSRAVACIHLTC